MAIVLWNLNKHTPKINANHVLLCKFNPLKSKTDTKTHYLQPLGMA